MKIRIRLGNDCDSSAAFQSQAQKLSRQGYGLVSKIRIGEDGTELAPASVEIASRLAQRCVIQSLAERGKISGSKIYGVPCQGRFQFSPVLTSCAQCYLRRFYVKAQKTLS